MCLLSSILGLFWGEQSHSRTVQGIMRCLGSTLEPHRPGYPLAFCFSLAHKPFWCRKSPASKHRVDSRFRNMLVERILGGNKKKEFKGVPAANCIIGGHDTKLEALGRCGGVEGGRNKAKRSSGWKTRKVTRRESVVRVATIGNTRIPCGKLRQTSRDELISLGRLSGQEAAKQGIKIPMTHKTSSGLKAGERKGVSSTYFFRSFSPSENICCMPTWVNWPAYMPPCSE